MSRIEPPPTIDAQAYTEALTAPPREDVTSLVERINDDYAYWDTVKYRQPLPDGFDAPKLWAYVKASRRRNALTIWPKYGVTLCVTNRMQRLCHEFDMRFSGFWETASVGATERERFLLSSLMEEAIFSSQMEGATTTRRVAKDMLRKKMSPRDRSQRMIANNYQTIQFIVAHKDEPLTPELLLHVHRLMTDGSLDNPEQAGRFRSNDEVVVEDGTTHEVVHRPPSHTEIPAFVDDLCRFFNEAEPPVFVHPILRGIVIHFMLAYGHPFADGNGRTARALFYWYLLRQGYWLMQYLSISRNIAAAKKSYEKSFLYAEADGLDIGYFVTYNLRQLELSFRQLQDYLQRKQAEQEAAHAYLQIDGINDRQAQILQYFADHPQAVLTVKDLQARFLVSPTTAKSDLLGLVSRGLVEEIAFNKVKKGYRRSGGQTGKL